MIREILQEYHIGLQQRPRETTKPTKDRGHLEYQYVYKQVLRVCGLAS